MSNYNQLIQALDYSASIIVMTDRDGAIQYVNRTFETKYGYTREEAMGLNPRVLRTNYHPKEFYKDLWDTILSGNTWQGVFRNKAKNGKLLWENAIINPIISDEGEITGFIAIKEDITDYKKTIDELEASNKRYLSLVEDAPAMICRFDKDGVLTDANTQYINTFFPDKDNIAGLSFYHYLPEEDKKIIQKQISELSIDSPIQEYENRIVLNGNTVRWHRNICRAIFNSKNEVIEYQAVSMDFTHLKETEDALITHQNKLNAIINNKLVGVAVNDVYGRVKIVNDQFVKMMGYKTEYDLYNCHYKEYTHPDYLEETESKFDALISGDIDNFHITIKYIRKDGSEFWGDLFASPIKSETGKIIEIVGMVTDNTARKEMELQMQKNEKELKHLNKTKDKLFSIIAHDIKNPFNVILGFASLLNSNFDEYSNEEIKGYINKILIASESVYKLLDDLLIWAKSQMGQLKVSPDRINTNEILDEVYNHFHVIASQKKINLINDLPDDILILADFEMIRFIFRNLVHNAIKFTPENGQIKCRGRVENDRCIIEIEDSGIGIRDEKLSTLFDMSDIMETKGTNEEKGTGLGLYLVREMTLINSGSISVTSAVGKGTIFTINLPKYQY